MSPREIQVDMKLFAGGKGNVRGFMLVITRWQLLGDGGSLFDERWRCRLCERCDPWLWHEGRAMANIKNTFVVLVFEWDSVLDAGEGWQGLH